MDEDAELLRRYTDEKSDEAFAELVRRHLNRVYAVALRQVAGDAHLAHDVTQQVFTALARKASALAERPALSGWLCRSAHFAASDVVRLERRRRAREQEVYAMNSLTSDATPPADWDRIRPALDAAMAELNEGDRDAVALRFFDGLSFAEVGTRLRLSENTARMRVERALDKLHAALARGGITSTTAALATVLGHQASAAPAGMMRAVTLASLKAAAGGEGVLVHLGIFMKKNSVMTAGVAAVAVGVLLVRSVAGGASEGDQAGTARNAAAGEASAPITAVAQRAAAGGAPAGSGSAAAAVPAAKPAPVNGPAAPGPMSPADAAEWEAIKQKRAIANNLRQLWAARDAFLKFKGRLPESLTDLVGPDKLVRELKPVAGEDYTTVRLADPVFSVTMANGTPVMLTVGAPAAKGPPTRAESAAWDRALADYLKTRAAAPAAASPVSGTTGAPGAGLELVGVLDTPEGRTFLIKDAVGGAPQKVRLGESVGRYVLTEYQAKDEMLMLRDGDATQRVKLREAKVVAPLATETQIAFQLIQEIQRREGWAVAAMRVQQPQRMDDGNWLVGAMQVLEQNERGLVGGDRISGIVSKEGKLISYTNRGRAQ